MIKVIAVEVWSAPGAYDASWSEVKGPYSSAESAG